MKRVELVLSNLDFHRWMELNKQKEAQRKFCIHDMKHVVDVARIMYILFLESGDTKKLLAALVDEKKCTVTEVEAKEIIYATALLHDIGRWKEYQTGEDHAQLGAEMAIPVLVTAGFNQTEIMIISKAIREHRSGVAPRTLLGEKLYRADKLSRPCLSCPVSGECYKIDSMETSKTAIIY